MVALAPVGWGQTADDPVVARAKDMLDLLGGDHFEEVAAQFNAQMAAALGPAQLRTVWATVRQQAGAFQSYLDHSVTTPAPGVTTVVLGCRFEHAVSDVLLAFDRENKIAGLRITPRTAPVAPAAPPPGSHFGEEAVTVGVGEWALPGTLSMLNPGAFDVETSLQILRGAAPESLGHRPELNVPGADSNNSFRSNR